jgi:hypothetical protein
MPQGEAPLFEVSLLMLGKLGMQSPGHILRRRAYQRHNHRAGGRTCFSTFTLQAQSSRFFTLWIYFVTWVGLVWSLCLSVPLCGFANLLQYDHHLTLNAFSTPKAPLFAVALMHAAHLAGW